MKYLPTLIILLSFSVGVFAQIPTFKPNTKNNLQLNYRLSIKDDLTLSYSGKFNSADTTKVTDLKYAVAYSIPIKGTTALSYSMDGNDYGENIKVGFGFQDENTKAAFTFSQRISSGIVKVKESDEVLMALDIETRF